MTEGQRGEGQAKSRLLCVAAGAGAGTGAGASSDCSSQPTLARCCLPAPCRHHPSDVIGGAFLGTLVASLYITRAVWRLDSVVVLPAAGCAAAAGCGGGAGTPDTESSLLHGDARASNV